MVNNAEKLSFSFSPEVTNSPIDMFVIQVESSQIIAELAYEIGFGAVHLKPARGVWYRQAIENKVSQAMIFSSAEMSPRSETTLQQILEHPSPIMAGASYVLYPERVSSLAAIENVQKLNPEAYAVIYPSHNPAKRNGEVWNQHWNETEYQKFKELNNKLLRPEPGLLDRWGVTTIEEFIAEARNRKYDGFALDAKHLVRPADRFNGFKTDFAPMEAIVPQLLVNTKMIDIHPLPHAEQKTKLEEMVDANELNLLIMAKNAEWNGLVVCHYPIGKFISKATDQRPLIKEIQQKIG